MPNTASPETIQSKISAPVNRLRFPIAPPLRRQHSLLNEVVNDHPKRRLIDSYYRLDLSETVAAASRSHGQNEAANASHLRRLLNEIRRSNARVTRVQ
jgi:hypothetical protein